MASGIEKYVSKRQKLLILSGNIPTWIQKHKRKDYILQAFLSAPLWVKSNMFKELRYQANQQRKYTQKPHVLDHIVPITHPYVCGLTVPWNIQVIPKQCNVAKSNSWHPDQISLELMIHKEQLQLPYA